MPSLRAHTVRVAVRRKLFVDSGAWIALRSRRDQYHAAADRAFRAAIEQGIPLVTTNLVVAESHRLTLFRAGYEPALRALRAIDASQAIAIHYGSAEDHRAAREWIERLAPRPITYTDAVSFAVVRATKCTHVLGFDEDFAAAGFDLWPI